MERDRRLSDADPAERENAAGEGVRTRDAGRLVGSADPGDAGRAPGCRTRRGTFHGGRARLTKDEAEADAGAFPTTGRCHENATRLGGAAPPGGQRRGGSWPGERS